MNVKRFSIAFSILLLLAVTLDARQIQIRGLGNKGRINAPKTKNIHGTVLDQAGKVIAGARVLVLNTKDNTTRTLTTDVAGNYSVQGLAADVDYEVRADFKGLVSEKKSISSMLDREDNMVNFQLNLTTASAAATPGTAVADPGPELQTFDLVKLKASFEMPRSVPAPIPAVLLIHGYGENRKVWEDFRKQLVDRGWAVLSLDLRGHGDSLVKNQRPLQASAEWRSNPREFPQDIDPALDWLKKQARLNSSKIVIVGYDIGANLALISSGKYREVRTVVAVNPNLKESLQMAGSAQDFRPRSALVITGNAAEMEPIKTYAKEPFRVLTQPVAGGTAQVFQEKAVADAIFQWLKETY
jgi:pimeloyl-ACP methyl ester carboxylesterase